MRILIDGRFIGVGESISRYTLEVVKGILELDKKNEYALLVRPQGKKTATEFLSRPEHIRQAQYKLCEGSRDSSPKAQNDKDVFASEVKQSTKKLPSNLHLKVLDIAHYSLLEQTKLLKYLNKEKYDLVHFTQFNHPVRYKGKFVVCIHDLTLLGHLYRMNPLKRLGFRAVMKSAVKNSTKIITISEYSKKDIVKTYGADPGKIEVTYLGIDEKFCQEVRSGKQEIRRFKGKYNIIGDYILYTGMWKRHKNIIRMLKAYELYLKKQITRNKSQTNSKLQIPNIQLVMVGKIDQNEPEVIKTINDINNRFCHSERSEESCGLKKDRCNPIVTTGYVDEDELPIAYAGALFYCIPSLSEGFGLPPLEAMACGTPVISSKISAMPEILGDAVEYFDPYSVDDIAKTMEKVAGDEKLREQLSKKGLERVKKYSWPKTAEETLKVYRSVQ